MKQLNNKGKVSGLVKLQLLGMLLVALFIGSCSSDDDGLGVGGTGSSAGGFIYFDWAGDVYKTNVANKKPSTFLPKNSDRNLWDISWDGQWILEVTDPPTSVDDWMFKEVYTVSTADSREVLHRFTLMPRYKNYRGAYLSPDKTMIAICPTVRSDEGIRIYNLDGRLLYNYTNYGASEFGLNTEIGWTRDNQIIFTVPRGIFKLDIKANKVTPVFSPNFAEWSEISISPTDGKIVFYGGRHLWTVHQDGTNLTQVTDGKDTEKYARFSPDGKYLLVGTDYRITGPFGNMSYLAVIPADDKTYNVEEGTRDPNVTFIPNALIKEPSRPVEAVSGDEFLWRP